MNKEYFFFSFLYTFWALFPFYFLGFVYESQVEVYSGSKCNLGDSAAVFMV